MTAKTILLVEDDFLNRRLTKKILLNSGYQVLESKNSEEALYIIQTEKINLIILDINLGDHKEEGILLGQQIKDLYRIPFIYLTAYANLTTITHASVTKPYSYLTKPFKEIDLIASIEIALKHVLAVSENLISSIQVKSQDHFMELALDSIDYFESKGNYLQCYVGNKIYRYRSTIKQILGLSTSVTFVQVHRAYLINKNRIQKYNSQMVHVGEKAISISRSYKKNLYQK